MISLVQAGVGFALLPGRMKKVYEKDVQLLKLAEPYQMRQLISIVYSAPSRTRCRPAGAGGGRTDVRPQY